MSKKYLSAFPDTINLATKGTGIGIWKYLFKEQRLFADEMLLSQYAITPADFNGTIDSLSANVSPEDKKKLKEGFHAAINSLKHFTSDIKVIRADNSIRHISVVAFVQYDDAGDPLYFMGTNQDITERKEAEKQRESDCLEKEVLINNTDDLMWSVSSDLKLIASNKAFINSIPANARISFQHGGVVRMEDVHSPESFPFWQKAYAKAMLGNIFKEELYTPAFNKQQESWEDIRFHPVNNNDEVVAVACYSKDITQQKIAELKLSYSEAHLAEAQNLAKTGSWEFDFVADKLTWSEELYNVFDTDRQTFVETHGSFLHFIDEDQRDLAEQTSRRTQETGEPFELQYNITTQKGERRVIQENGYGIKNETGKVIRLFGTAQNITESRKIQDELRQSEFRYRSLIEQATDSICIADVDLKLTVINPYACELLGYSAEEALQLHVPDLLFKKELEENPLRIEELKKGKTIISERRLKTKSGKAVEMELSTKMLDDGGLIMYGHNITERKKAEKRIGESEAKYRAFFENSIDGMLLTLTDGAILSANPAACEMFRMTEEEVRAAGRYGIIDTNDLRAEALIRERQRSGKAKGELTYLRKDGSKFPGEISSVLFTDSYGQAKTCMVIRDISERKQAEEKLVSASNDLQKAVQDLNKIMDASLDVICAVDEKGRIIKVSAASESVWGYKPEELTGRFIFDLVYPEDNESTVKSADHVMAGNNLIHFENRYLHKNGSLVSIEWSTRWDAEDKIRYGIARDITMRKKLEKALESEQRRLKDLFFQAPTSMGILKGPKHVFEIANPLYLDLTGKTDIVGKTVEEALPEVGDQGLIKKLDQVYETGETFTANEMLVRLIHSGNGQPVDKYLNFIYQAYRDVEDKIEGIFFFIIDVTEQVLSRKKIEESERRYRTLFEQNLAGFYQSNSAGDLFNCNKAFAKMLKYESPEELLKVNANELYFSTEEREDLIQGVLKKKKLVNYEGVLKCKDGSPLYFLENISEQTDPVNGTQFFDGILIDITEKKITESQLKDINEKFIKSLEEKNTILESIGDAFFAVDKNWTVTYWNKEAEKMLGRTKKEIIGGNFWDVFPHWINSEYHEKFHEAVKSRQVVDFEVSYEGFDKWFEAIAYPSDGGLSVYFKDVTDRKHSEIELNTLNKNLQKQARALTQSNEELEQFAYVASHDLQEPLRMVSSFLSLLEGKYGHIIDEKGKKYIDFAVDGAKRMRQIILDLLEFSRATKIEQEVEKVDVNKLIEGIKILLSKQLEEKRAVLIQTDLPVISGYESALRQVFQNLISNALKYSRDDIPCQIEISATKLNRHWQFTVKDNGIGIAEEYFDKIFLIFQRLHHKSEFSGTGVGLAVTKKLIENLGGKIWVESEVGKGSTFYFTLLQTNG